MPMLKSILFLLFLLPAAFAFDVPAEIPTCVCPEITNLSVTGQTNNSITFSWTAPDEATQFKTWYVRQSDGFTSEFFFTTSPSFTFTNLSQGRYDFYFVTLCGGEPSGIIGVSDVIMG